MRQSPHIGRTASSLTLALCALVCPLGAQGPVFLTPPNTTPARDMVSALSYARKGEENDLQLAANLGIRRGLSAGLGALAIDSSAGGFRLARLQAQVKVRLAQREREWGRAVLSFSGGWGMPLGPTVDGLARAMGVSRFSGGLTAARLAHRMSYFASGVYTVDAHDVRDRSTGTLGLAVAWRPKPAPPGAVGGPGLTTFAEVFAHYETNHSGWLALAPSFVFKAGDAQLRGGVRVPVRRWNSASRLQVTLGTSMFIRFRRS